MFVFLVSVAVPTVTVGKGIKNKRASLGSFQGKPYIRARMPATSNKV